MARQNIPLAGMLYPIALAQLVHSLLVSAWTHRVVFLLDPLSAFVSVC